jgi:hypothetical protein
MSENIDKTWIEMDIPLKDLVLWDENSRLRDDLFGSDQQNLINTYLTEKKFKLKEFVEKVVQDFDLPQIEMIIVVEKEGQYIVYEGNRRLTSYKCLANPQLAGNLESFFHKQKLGIDIDGNYTLKALVTKDVEQAYRLIDRKHYENNNVVQWGEAERHNHKVRTNAASDGNSRADIESKFRVNLGELVKETDLPNEFKKQILGVGFVTTFYRLLAGTEARESLRYEKLEDGSLRIDNKHEFLLKLKVIIYNLLNKRDFHGHILNTRTLNTNQQIKDYFDSVLASDASKVDEEIERHENGGLFSQIESSTNTGNNESEEFPPLDVATDTNTGSKVVTDPSIFKRSNPNLANRKTLIPSNNILKIDNSRLNQIYYELRSLNIDEFPNAAAVLYRVFLEGSLDEYIDKKNISLRSKDPKLFEKLGAVRDALNLNNVEKKPINTAISSKDSIYSINTFNAYVHNNKFHPNQNDLKNTWNNFWAFFQKLWHDMK